MKNKNLKEKLNIYADCLERKEEILYGAYHAMDLKRNSGAYDKKKSAFKKRFRLAGLTAAAVIFIVAIGIILSNLADSGGKSSVEPYSLSSLQKKAVSQQYFSQISDTLFLTGEEGQTDGRFFIYVNQNNDVYAAKALYKVVRDGSVDEITIISDLKNNLSDYKANKPSENNAVIRNFDYYENGEYYSYLAAFANNKTYYITITSPSMYAGVYYENILL